MGRTTGEVEERMISILSTDSGLSPAPACLGAPAAEPEHHFPVSLEVEPESNGEPTGSDTEEPTSKIKVGDVVNLNGFSFQNLAVIGILTNNEARVAWFDDGYLNKADIPVDALTVKIRD